MNFKTPQFVISRILDTFSGHFESPQQHTNWMYSPTHQHLFACMCECVCVCVLVFWVCVYMLVYFFYSWHQRDFFTSSTRRRGICRKLRSSFNLTCVCRSGKQSLMLRKTSLFSCEHIEPFIHESFDVPSLLCSQSDVSLSLTFAIFTFTSIHTRRTYNLARLT